MTQNNDLDKDIEASLDHYKIDYRMGRDTGIAASLLVNNETYKAFSGDWEYRDMSTPVTEIIQGRRDGKFYQTEIQYNTEAVAKWCQRYRKMSEEGIPDLLAPPDSSGKPGFRWINLPKVIARRIQNEYFDGTPWEIIKTDKIQKAIFYQIVERDYNVYVCHPGGKLPLPIRPKIPSRRGGEKTIFAQNWAKGTE